MRDVLYAAQGIPGKFTVWREGGAGEPSCVCAAGVHCMWVGGCTAVVPLAVVPAQLSPSARESALCVPYTFLLIVLGVCPDWATC